MRWKGIEEKSAYWKFLPMELVSKRSSLVKVRKKCLLEIFAQGAGFKTFKFGQGEGTGRF